MRPSVLIVVFVSCFLINLQSQTSNNPANSRQLAMNQSPSYSHIPTWTDSEIRQRLSQINSAIAKPRFTSAVKSYINTYTVKRRDRTEKMLGRTTIYFPLFDKYLEEAQLPSELKYLSIVESALNPIAISRSGAVGLWQFMPPTGKDYGLRINSTVDERRDPNKSTKAALKYLSKLYNRYGNWELALAAYNGGPGRVNRAVKRGRSKNFWRIQKHLPKETRNYVPAFIAATYIMNYYEMHNLVPSYPESDLQSARSEMIYDRLSFYDIGNITGTPMYLIEKLNPSFKRKYIPSSQRGNWVILPEQYMPALLNHLGRPDTFVKQMVSVPIPAPVDNWEENYFKTIYTVEPNDQIQDIADRFGCTIQNIQLWNGFRHEFLTRGQELNIYVTKPLSQFDYYQINNVHSLKMNEVKARTTNNSIIKETPAKKASVTKKSVKKAAAKKNRSALKYNSSKANKEDNYIYYLVRRNEPLVEIANRFSGVNIEDIVSLNNFENNYQLKPGTKIKIKQR